LFIDLTPFISLSLKGEGESYRRGATPLLNTPGGRFPIYRVHASRRKKRDSREGRTWVPTKIKFCEVKAPFKISLPSPLQRRAKERRISSLLKTFS